MVVVPQCEGLGIGESKLEFISKTIQICYWRLNEVIPQLFKVNNLNYVKRKRRVPDRLDSLGYISQMKLAIRPVVLLRRQEKKSPFSVNVQRSPPKIWVTPTLLRRWRAS